MVYTLECLSQAEQRLLQLLVETSFRVSETEQFRLSSGRCSPYYVDCKMVLALPEARELIGAVMIDRFAEILSRVDAVGGLELSAYPLAIAVSDAAYRDDMKRNLLAFVVRKEPKQHGLTKQLEGLERPADQRKKVLIVDDVITTGESTLKAITTCRELGLDVVHALVLIDREEDGGRQRIEKTGVPFDALFTLAQLADTAKKYKAN